MIDVRKYVEEANEIAKFMNKNIKFTQIYVSKFDDQSIYSKSGTTPFDVEMETEVQVKVENFDSGQVNRWSCEKFNDKLAMMRYSLQLYEQNEFQDLKEDEDPFFEKQEPILLGQAFYMLEGLAY